MAFAGRRRGGFGERVRPKGRTVPVVGDKKEETAAAAAAVPSVEAEAAGETTGGGAVEEAGVSEQEATAAPIGPPQAKKKPKQTKLVAAGTFSLPGAGRAAALRSPGLVRGKIGPPVKPFSGQRRRRRGVESTIPEEIGAGGNVAAVSPKSGSLDDEEYAKLMASKVLAGGL